MIKLQDAMALMMVWAALFFPYYWSLLQQPLGPTTAQLPTLILATFISYIIISIGAISLKTS